jgi:hypothetical protein
MGENRSQRMGDSGEKAPSFPGGSETICPLSPLPFLEPPAPHPAPSQPSLTCQMTKKMREAHSTRVSM